MRARTLTKWSLETRTFNAAELRTELERRPAVVTKNACTLSTAFPAALLCGLTLRSCSRDTALVLGFTVTCCKSTSFLLALKFSSAPVLSSTVASLRALSSSARMSERLSHCTAFFSHSSLTTAKKSESAVFALSSASLSACVAASSSRVDASRASFSSLSVVSNAILFVRPTIFESEAFLASNSVMSISFMVLLKEARMSAKVCKSALPWYWYLAASPG
mmetsp:Transcript_89210/g.154330  ORF Transcript_89210/g.154330 Transcript_89210/m.154330 type:complete len:220 (+) Transcript_89210:927-1586(+)